MPQNSEKTWTWPYTQTQTKSGLRINPWDPKPTWVVDFGGEEKLKGLACSTHADESGKKRTTRPRASRATAPCPVTPPK